MTSISTGKLSAEKRLEILNGQACKNVELQCTGDILSTIFYADDDMQFSNSQSAISGALSFYWHILRCASRIFSPVEWAALSATHSPFVDERYQRLPASSAASLVAVAFPGDDWNDEVLAVKALLPKVASLSDTEFAAVARILQYVASLSCPDPISAVALKLPALKA